MKVLRVTHMGVEPIIINSRMIKNKKVFNIMHGMEGKKTFTYSMGVCNKTICNNIEGTRYQLDEDNYDISEIYAKYNGEYNLMHNRLGDTMYYIKRVNTHSTTGWHLLFIEPMLTLNSRLDIVGDYISLGKGQFLNHNNDIVDGPVIKVEDNAKIIFKDSKKTIMYDIGEEISKQEI